MIAFMLAIAATASATAGLPKPARADLACMLSKSCARPDVDRDDSDMRLAQSVAPSQDLKMDAYRLDSRPCRLIGNLRCLGKMRTIWRMGEPLQQTLARSFGLD